MRPGAWRRLVVDTDVVVRASARENRLRTSGKRCRQALMAILRICHRVVLTPDIHREWQDHPSRFQRKWRRWMHGKRKFALVSSAPKERLRKRIARAAPSPSAQEVLDKDVHLVEAALATDRTIISCDAEAHDLFHAVAARVGELRTIAWLNPERMAPPDMEAWLEAGAQPDDSMKLGCADEPQTRANRPTKVP
jgi:hypothetical protein